VAEFEEINLPMVKTNKPRSLYEAYGYS